MPTQLTIKEINNKTSEGRMIGLSGLITSKEAETGFNH